MKFHKQGHLCSGKSNLAYVRAILMCCSTGTCPVLLPGVGVSDQVTWVHPPEYIYSILASMCDSHGKWYVNWVRGVWKGWGGCVNPVLWCATGRIGKHRVCRPAAGVCRLVHNRHIPVPTHRTAGRHTTHLKSHTFFPSAPTAFWIDTPVLVRNNKCTL